MNRRQFVFLTAASGPVFRCAAEAAAGDLKSQIEKIRTQHGVPALTAGLVTTDGLAQSAVTGVRKAGGSTPALATDLWHYGSLTKAMTATLLGTFVAAGKLKWDALLKDLTPDLMRGATPAARRITLRHLLTHRSGLRGNLEHWGRVRAPGNRPEIVREEVARDLAAEPGAKYLYSNIGYMIAGVVAERLGGALWEKVITERLFKPLGMKAGFGGTGTEGKEDQPWPHTEDGRPKPNNGPFMDNPPSLGPAGTCHASLANYAKFIADHLRGESKQKSLLPQHLYTDLHTAPPGTDYALGWRTAERDWAGGPALTHNGTNTMNYAVVWMAPRKGFAVVAASNQGGDKAIAACDAACSVLIAEHENTN